MLEVLADAPEAERPVGRLRLIAAVASVIGALWVIALSDGAPLSFVLLAAVLAAAWFWWRRFSSVERGVLRGTRRELVLAEDGLSYDDGEGRVLVRWTDVERIELDHDRICVLVVHRAGTTSIEPPLAGHGLDALGERVHRAFRSRAFHDGGRRP